MKHIIILGDGMADEPIAAFGGKTPLQAADTPYMDKLARMGKTGLLSTVPDGFKPGSEIANLEVLGYDVRKSFEGRGSLEAASMGIPINEGEMALRCNLICIQDGKIKNHSAGHISNEEAKELIEYLQKELGNETFSFYNGVSYRHLLKMKGGDKRIDCTPPHDVPGTAYKEVMIKALVPEARETADKLNALILHSMDLLPKHPINLKRAAAGKDMANSIWPWSPGYKPDMETLSEKFGINNGTVISAVDLIKGIGVFAGLKPVEVEGATGLYDTNYEGKAAAAIEALKQGDFVFLHVEASDEAGHDGNPELKKTTIEYLDKRIIGPVYEEISKWDSPVAIAVLPDHPTPCAIKTHSRNPVPFLIYKPGMEPDEVQVFDEYSVKDGGYGHLYGEQFIQEFLSDNK